jgi:hypothetical protein
MKITDSKNFKTVMAIMAVAGLLITLIPSILNWQGIIGEKNVATLMMVGTVVWFVPAIFIFGKKKDAS